jgi:hypothetical protein
MRKHQSSKRSSKKADCGKKAIYVRVPANMSEVANIQNKFVRAGGATGWLAQEMKKSWSANKVISPVDGIKYATISGGNLLNWNYNNYAQFVDAAENVLLGEATKEAPAPQVKVAAANLVLPLATASIGALFQFSDSNLNADYRKVILAVSGTGITPYTVAITPCSNSFSILLFALSNNAGQATLRATNDFTVTILDGNIRDGSFGSVETLNLRDLIRRSNPC